MLQSSQRVAMEHVLVAVRPMNLRQRLQGDIEFKHADLERDFRGSMNHALDIADAFGRIDTGPAKADDGNRRPYPGIRKVLLRKHEKCDGSTKGSSKLRKGGLKEKNQPSLCLIEGCKIEGRRHYFGRCKYRTRVEHKAASDTHRAKRAKHGPVNNTKSKRS